MRALALHGSPRRLLTKLHRWSGLAVLVGLMVASLTGTVLVFRAELDRFITPHLFVVAPAGPRLPVATLVSGVEQRFPNTTMSSVTLPAAASDPLVVYLRPVREDKKARGSRAE